MSTNKHTLGKLVFASVIIVLAICLINRAGTYGLNNVLSRERRFYDQRPLTEQVAIELTKQTLRRDGHDTSELHPLDRSRHSPAPIEPQVLSRTDETSNSGYVQWVSRDRRRMFVVTIERSESDYRCRVLRGK